MFKNKEWIRVEGNVAQRYMQLFTCNERRFNLRLLEEIGIYSSGWISRLRQNRPFGLMMFYYVERGEVSTLMHYACYKVLRFYVC
jgi:hypothetical protein